MDRPLSVRSLGDIPSLLRRYANGDLTPSQMVEGVHALVQNDADHVWIHTLPLATLKAYARAVEVKASANGMEALPLYGIPFAIKDNIDLAGVPTTAACPAFAYTPQH
ncbi:MAG: amidase family protein, partial [Nitrosospira sp.]